MAPYAATVFGHPSGSHRQARGARKALEDAREQVASLLGARPGEIVFTSGGTEADNLAVLGVLSRAARLDPVPPGTPHVPGTPAAHGAPEGRATVVVTSPLEHAGVLEPCRLAAARIRGVEHRTCRAGASGVIDMDDFEELVAETARTAVVALVSVMLANNESGAVQPLSAVVEATRSLAPGAVVHTDAVQASPWLDLAKAAKGADLVSISAHKLGGPKGAGALVVREGCLLDPMVVGGGQERERRAGTHNVAGAVGLAAALGAASAAREEESVRVGALRDRLADGLLSTVEAVREVADRKHVLPGHCQLAFEGVDREELVLLLDDAGICVSGGAACASGALEPSHVLSAMGVPRTAARGAIRFSLGHTTGAADVDRALEVVPRAVERLRA